MVRRVDPRRGMDEIRIDGPWAAHDGWRALHECQRDFVSVTPAADGQRVYDLASTSIQLLDCEADDVHQLLHRIVHCAVHLPSNGIRSGRSVEFIRIAGRIRSVTAAMHCLVCVHDQHGNDNS